MDKHARKRKAAPGAAHSERSDLKTKSRDALGRATADARATAPGRGTDARGAPLKPGRKGRPA